MKIFNWLFTMYGGRVRFSVPMHYAIGFMLTFVIGGLTGVLLAIPPVDFVVHNSLFLVAHFHHVIIGGVVFGVMAGYTYWFPKAFGFTLDERIGKAIFWCWFIGFHLAFMPLYVLGLMGATRRMQHIRRPELAAVDVRRAGRRGDHRARDRADGRPALYSIKTRDQRRDVTGDPWDGRTLEWLTLSPPPHYNFAVLPDVHGEEAYWTRKQTAIKQDQLIEEPDYQPIEMPLNTPVGVISPSSPRSAASRSSGTSGGSRSSASSAPLRCSSGTHGATSMSISFPSRRSGRTRASGAGFAWSTSTI